MLPGGKDPVKPHALFSAGEYYMLRGRRIGELSFCLICA